MSRAVLTFSSDGGPAEGLGRLRLAIETPTFSGTGEVWTWPEFLKDFAAGLMKFPVSADSAPELRVGYDKVEGEDLIVGLTIKAVDPRGTLTVYAEVSDGIDRESRLKTHFSTHYPDVERFQRQLRALAEGRGNEAVLEGS